MTLYKIVFHIASFDITLNILTGESISLHFDENYDGRNNRSSHFGYL
jgi:hypothetical protein